MHPEGVPLLAGATEEYDPFRVDRKWWWGNRFPGALPLAMEFDPVGVA